MTTTRLLIGPKFLLRLTLACLACCFTLGTSLEADEQDFLVVPQAISLDGPDAMARFQVLGVLPNSDKGNPTFTGPLTNKSLSQNFSTPSPYPLPRSGGEGSGIGFWYHAHVADSSIARVEGQQIVAVGNGATEMLVRVGDLPRVARVPIIVRHVDQPKRWQFNAHVQSVLTRQGCNSGACHGALAGKGGFRLSLLGYDSSSDHFTITAQDNGRRVEPADPTASLLLSKPTMRVPHQGGLKLDEHSAEFQILAQWIAAGSPGPLPEDAALMSIEVLPDSLRLQTNNQQDLIVRAHYQDGRIEDVTGWAKFSSSNEAVVKVDRSGKISVIGPGRGAIVAWFASRIAMVTIDVPYSMPQDSNLAATDSSAAHETKSLSPNPFNRFGGEGKVRGLSSSGIGSKLHDVNLAIGDLNDFVPVNFIDEILMEEWRSLGLAPSPGCDDATFLRRAHLDTTGTLPSADEVVDFLKAEAPDRRSQLVDRLLASREYVDYWSYLWSDLLLVNGNLLRPQAVEAFYGWIRSQVEQNTPWDQFARSIVLAKGSSIQQGATNFYAIHQTPEAQSENACLAFLGLSIECAKCHNHPLERWTNDQYYAMANLFSRVRAKGWGGDPRNGDGLRTLVVLESGDLIQPSRGKPQPPAPLDQAPLEVDSTEDRRLALADWLTAVDNPYFSRAIVNRVWANFMGVGLVEPVDDLRTSNPASSQRLMTALSNYLVAHNYDLKALMRLILNSRVYQLSSLATPYNEQDKRLFCRYYPRRLMAEVLHDAVVTVTDVPTTFDNIDFSGADKQPTSLYPLGTKALGLYDSAVSNNFLQIFGRHQRRITCDCERSDQPTVIQALHWNNGNTLNDKLSHKDSIVSRWIDQKMTAEQVIQNAYLRSLSRPPTPSEQQQVLSTLASTDQSSEQPSDAASREVYEDLLWSLMSSREFLLAH